MSLSYLLLAALMGASPWHQASALAGHPNAPQVSASTTPQTSQTSQTPKPDATQSPKPDTPQAQTETSGAGELPVSLARIQRALSGPPTIRLLESRTRDGRPLYRVDIEGEKIDITSILGKDFTRGPASYGAMTHQEFLNMVTPDDVRGYAPFSNGQGMVVAATSIALQWAVLKAMDSLKEAKNERAKVQARREVQEALEALRKARKAAGLPDL